MSTLSSAPASGPASHLHCTSDLTCTSATSRHCIRGPRLHDHTPWLHGRKQEVHRHTPRAAYDGLRDACAALHRGMSGRGGGGSHERKWWRRVEEGGGGWRRVEGRGWVMALGVARASCGHRVPIWCRHSWTEPQLHRASAAQAEEGSGDGEAAGEERPRQQERNRDEALPAEHEHVESSVGFQLKCDAHHEGAEHLTE